MKIGFIGTGIMGSRMAGHLLTAGHTLTVYNRTTAKAQPLADRGATLVHSPAAAAHDVDVLFTMLAHPRAVKAAASGEQGFLGALPKGALWMNGSTVNPSFAEEMGEWAAGQGVRYLDAPVAGSKPQAEGAQLVFFLGGTAEDVEQVKPLTEAMGQKAVHVGAVGKGSALKIVVNQQLAVSMAAFSEGVALGESQGLPREFVMGVLLNGPLVPPYLHAKREQILAGAFDQVAFPLQWIQKDLEMATHTAYETGATMPVSNAAKEAYRQAMRQGHGEADYSAIFDWYTRPGK